MNRLQGVQHLRAAAALAVVCFHAAERAGTYFAIGAAGVDVFFVISGFIMWVIAETRPVSPGRFIRDRLERIAPTYSAATAVMVAGALLGLFPNLKLTAGHVLGSILFIPHRSPSNGEIWPVLVQGWTLNYEMFFYVVFAGVLFLPRKSRLAALAAVLLGTVACGILVRSANPLVETYTRPIVLEFLVGAAIGKLWLHGRIPAPAFGIALILVALSGFAFVGITHLGFTAWVFGPLAAMLLLGVLALEESGGPNRIRFVTYLGDASYSIYLWHAMAISVIAKLGAALALPVPLTVTASVAAGIVVGIAAHEILEKPVAAILMGRRATGPGIARLPA